MKDNRPAKLNYAELNMGTARENSMRKVKKQGPGSTGTNVSSSALLLAVAGAAYVFAHV